MRQELIFHELHIRPDLLDLYATVSSLDNPIEIGDFAIVDAPDEGFCIVQPEDAGDLEFLNEHKGEKILITTNPDHKLPMFELVFLQAYALTKGNITGFVDLQTMESPVGDFIRAIINEDDTVSIEIGQTPMSIDEIIDSKNKLEESLRDLVKDNPNIVIVSAEDFLSEQESRILTLEEIVWGIRMNQLTLEDAIEALKKLHDIQLN